MLLRKLFESITTLTGSKRGDAEFEARSIAHRSTIGHNLSGDESFAKLATLAIEIDELLSDHERTTDSQVSSIVDRLKPMRGQLHILEARHDLKDRISKACLARNTGALDAGKTVNVGVTAEESEWRNMIRMVLVASDKKNKLWPDAEVLAAQALFGLNGVPSYDALSLRFGEAILDQTMQELIQERVGWLQFQAALQGSNDPCHICGATTKLTYHDFGLLRLLSKETDWKLSAASAAMSALTIPTMGFGLVRGPDSTRTANILRMRLVLCESCLEGRQGYSAKLKLTVADCSRHPLWSKAHDAGFDTFVEGLDLDGWR